MLQGTLVDTRASNGNTGALEIIGNALKVGESTATDNIHASTLASNLSTTNVSLASNVGDVEVNAPVNWDSGHALTLNARHGGDGKVMVNAALTAKGAGTALNLSADRLIDISRRITLSGVSSQVNLRTTQSGTPGLASTANYVLSGPAGQALIQLPSANPQFTSNGLRHVVIQNLAQLNAINGHLTGYYVLGTDIQGPGSVQSIGAGQGGFKGLFDGLGNKLVKLAAVSPDGVAGLFSESSGTLRNVTLDNISSAGLRHKYSGTLVGINTGTISNVRVINGSRGGSTITDGAIGGLVGFNNGGTIERSSYSGSVATSSQVHIAGAGWLEHRWRHPRQRQLGIGERHGQPRRHRPYRRTGGPQSGQPDHQLHQLVFGHFQPAEQCRRPGRHKLRPDHRQLQQRSHIKIGQRYCRRPGGRK